tara:strand:- start:3700 stop:4263 length:564 start_codon:yes stop_codon:yes gene_type:complete
MKIKLCEKDEQQFIDIAKERSVYLEGNIIKLIEPSSTFSEYLETALKEDVKRREQRLQLTKVIQDQNDDLTSKASENSALMDELKEALNEAENAKEEALNDLDLVQKKTQFELINSIVNYALYVIVGTGIITTALYITAIWLNSGETTLIGNTWSNLFGILLTNSFSIIGTIMGVKYANNSENSKGD